MKKYPKICLIGGHLSPAYAIAQYFRKTYPNVSLLFIGREKSFTDQSYAQDSVESEIMKKTVERVILLPIERFGANPKTWVSLIKNIRLVIRLLSKEKPDCLVSFGGYVAISVVIGGFLKGIPLVIHEQTHKMGVANRLCGLYAKKICVSFEDMVGGKKVFTGLPIRQDVISPPKNCSFSFPKHIPIVYITGGTTGAVAINKLFFPIIDRVTEEHIVIHQTGFGSFAEAEKIRDELPNSRKEHYVISAYFSPPDVGWLMHNATVVIGRSGANTVYELGLTKIPSILIPLPNAVGNEQMINALWLRAFAPTVIYDQNDVTSEKILKSIEGLRITSTVSKDRYLFLPIDGTKRLVNEILGVIS